MSETTQTLVERPAGLTFAERYFVLSLGSQGMITTELPMEGSVVIGREVTTQGIRLEDPAASRKHAELVVHDGRVAIRDLGSQNGTRVRGVQIRGECPITSADLIEIGASVLLLRHSRELLQGIQPSGHVLFERRLQEECGLARRSKQCVGLVMIESASGSGALGSLVRSFFRRADTVEEYGAGQYEAIVPAPNAEVVEKLVARLAQGIQQSSAGALVGVAVFPRDATSPDELFSASRTALRLAGRGQAADQPPKGEPEQALPVLQSPAMIAVYQMIDQVALGRISVLITGETGSGKEMAAAAIHHRSPRSARPFVRINCAGLNEQLLESELFGHVKGAFTGAIKDKPGLFEHAHGGTLLLDEIGEMPPALQAKLLRVLEDNAVRRVGGLEPLAVDVRVLSATNRDLTAMVKDGAFREDLYWRLCGVAIGLPPLRDRPEEISILARHFLAKYAAEMAKPVPCLTPELEVRLRQYSWPGNVRQLRNVMERAVLLSRDGLVDPGELPEALAPRAASASGAGLSFTAAASTQVPPVPEPSSDQPFRAQLEEIERARIVAALEACGQNQTAAARALGMPRRTFLTKLDRYGIDRPRKNHPRGPEEGQD